MHDLRYLQWVQKRFFILKFKGSRRRFCTPQCQPPPLGAVAGTVEVIAALRSDPIPNVDSCNRKSSILSGHYRNILNYLITLKAVWSANCFSLATPHKAPDSLWPEMRKSEVSLAIFGRSQPVSKHSVGGIFSWLANLCPSRLKSYSSLAFGMQFWLPSVG